MALEAPLIPIVFVVRLAIAIVAFLYFRIIYKGILMGYNFDKILEDHEKGKKQNKKGII